MSTEVSEHVALADSALRALKLWNESPLAMPRTDQAAAQIQAVIEILEHESNAGDVFSSLAKAKERSA